jgi:hypothetical protein
MKLLCIILIVVGLSILTLRHYLKREEFRRLNCFTDETFKLFRKTGIIYMKCTRLYGRYFDKPVLFLVDTGATTNFIRQSLIEEVYPQYEQHILYGDDVMSVNGTMTLNRIVDIPVHFSPSLDCHISATLLTETNSLDYLSDECGSYVAGIVGTEFLKEHGVNIDFTRL